MTGSDHSRKPESPKAASAFSMFGISRENRERSANHATIPPVFLRALVVNGS
jgi:hypothetical protein